MSIHSLYVSTSCNEGTAKATEAINRAIKWEQDPANIAEELCDSDDDDEQEEVEHIFMIVAEEELLTNHINGGFGIGRGNTNTVIPSVEDKMCLMFTTEGVPQTSTATQDDGRPDSGTVSTYHLLHVPQELLGRQSDGDAVVSMHQLRKDYLQPLLWPYPQSRRTTVWKLPGSSVQCLEVS